MYQNFNTLLQTIHQYKLFPPNKTYLVAVSGGADSLALLHFLATHHNQLNIKLHCATLNHGLREAASNDVAFVEQFAKSLGIPCTSGVADVPSIASENSIGIEASARMVRYNFLAETAKKLNVSYVVTAHHADDQSETILMHILRGSGSKGLQGMQMISNMPYHPNLALLRPMLHVSRREIEAYCDEHNLEPRVDISNFDTRYLRNEIRNEILPRLRQINPQLDTALAKLSAISSAEQEFIQQSYQNYFKKHVKFADRVSISLHTFNNWHIAMKRYSIMDALAYFDIEPSFEHIQQAIELAKQANVGAISEFAGNLRLRVDYDLLNIEPSDLVLPTNDFIQVDSELDLRIPSKTILGDYSLIISKDELPDFDACLFIPEHSKISIRPRNAGDRFQPQGLNGRTQKIKKYFIDKKIPRHVRDKIPLLIVDKEIAGIILPDEWRIGESFIQNEISQCNVYCKVSKL